MDQCSHRHDIPAALQATQPAGAHSLSRNRHIISWLAQCSPAGGSVISLSPTGPKPRHRRADRFPLGWTRKDAALADTFSIEQSAVDRTRAGLQLVEMGQTAVTAQVVG